MARRGHAGRLVGVDLSVGMPHAVRARASAAALAAGDVTALPLADCVADVTLAMHMLYHVPDRKAAARELRRVTRDGGTVLVVLNGVDHLAELRELVLDAAAEAGLPAEAAWAVNGRAGGGLSLDDGAELLADVFETVERHDCAGELIAW